MDSNSSVSELPGWLLTVFIPGFPGKNLNPADLRWGRGTCIFGGHSVGDSGFPGGTSGKEPTCLCRRRKRCGFDPSVGKIPL